jgi:ubiquinone/menaquinone biosynthesis C-methylase UbiE
MTTTTILDDDVVDESYEPFSREPEYVDVNRLFMDTLDLAERTRVLDLACGTSTLTPMILERTPRSGSARVVGMDLAHDGLLLGREFIAGVPGADRVHYVQGTGAQLPFNARSFDAVVLGNAIQLIDPKETLASEVARVIRPGGLFAFNTSFYAGAYLPETERFYLGWVQEALSELRRTPGVVRRKGMGRPAFTRPWLSPAQYQSMLERNGFEVVATAERIVMLTQRCFETIGAYAGMAKVLLSGYPVRLACAALARATEPALRSAGVSAIPRKWLEMVAISRPESA